MTRHPYNSDVLHVDVLSGETNAPDEDEGEDVGIEFRVGESAPLTDELVAIANAAEDALWNGGDSTRINDARHAALWDALLTLSGRLDQRFSRE